MALKPPGCRFQLTPSRRATTDCQRRNKSADISTHALTEGDSCFFSKIFFEIYFNSRPHGGRRLSRNSPIVLVYFNSRPHGGRHVNQASGYFVVTFQLTPSRRATFVLQILLFSFPFQLTPSRRATKSGSVLVLQWEFQLTPSRRATSGIFSVALIVFNFNSRPHGGRRGRSEMPYDNAAFQLTPSRRATRI